MTFQANNFSLEKSWKHLEDMTTSTASPPPGLPPPITEPPPPKIEGKKGGRGVPEEGGGGAEGGGMDLEAGMLAEMFPDINPLYLSKVYIAKDCNLTQTVSTLLSFDCDPEDLEENSPKKSEITEKNENKSASVEGGVELKDPSIKLIQKLKEEEKVSLQRTEHDASLALCLQLQEQEQSTDRNSKGKGKKTLRGRKFGLGNGGSGWGKTSLQGKDGQPSGIREALAAVDMQRQEDRRSRRVGVGRCRRARSSSRGRKISPRRGPVGGDLNNAWKISKKKISSKMKQEGLKDLFPLVNSFLIENALYYASNDYYVALSWLHYQYPNPKAREKIRQIESEKSVPLISEPTKNQEEREDQKRGRRDSLEISRDLSRFLEKNLMPLPGERKKGGGEEVYRKFRNRVHKLREERNKMYRRFAEDPRVWAAKSIEVKQLRDKIQQAELDALKGIYLFKNASVDNREEVDLHGLHASESKKILSKLFKLAIQAGRKEYTVITGIGLHSRGKASLGPSVEAFVSRLGHSCTTKNPGALKIIFRA
ncbi:hypothetical protein AAMO2058_000627100 [Amorphochlora amoebiformis]